MALQDGEAKALQAVAETAGKAIEASQDMGKFINRIFGGLIEDSVGLLADKLKYYRAEKLIALHEKTKKKLQDQGVTSTHPVLPKIGIPLIEQATIEDNDELHSLWANMLANAMNPEHAGTIKRRYISILSDMEPLDVLILDKLIKEYAAIPSDKKEAALFDRAKLSQVLNVSLEQCEISLRNLMRLGCLKPGVIHNTNISVGGHSPSTYKDTEFVGITALGLEFYKAVS